MVYQKWTHGKVGEVVKLENFCIVNIKKYNLITRSGIGMTAIIYALLSATSGHSSASPRRAECNRLGPKELMHRCEVFVDSTERKEKVFKYPAITPLFDISGPASGLRVPFFLSSNDGSTIAIHYTTYGNRTVSKSTLQFTLESKQILSWKASFLGKDNSAAVSTVVVGVLLFWPALLAAPFISHDITGFEISYIDKFGSESSVSFATTAPSSLHQKFLENTTSLKMGEIRDSSELDELFKAGLANLTKKHLAIQAKVYQVNSRKPWCTSLDPTASLEDKKRYKQVDKDLNKLRIRLGLDGVSPIQGTASSAQWDNYIMNNENFSKWASANPSQAIKLKDCK